jgi:hypothetical protein
MSNLLEQASLVMIPSGYKEDVVYSEIPIDGSGDMSFTRSSNGTRINSAGLVEVVPWNLAILSEDFTDPAWFKSSVTITGNATTSPNGTMTADKIAEDSTNDFHITGINTNIVSGQQYTLSFYAKASERNFARILAGSPPFASVYAYFDLVNGITTTNATSSAIESIGSGWYRCSMTLTATSTGSGVSMWFGPARNMTDTYSGYQGISGNGIFGWGAQINLGALKPYFPTTDRLNVPRLTYQNGGGGCPSLLLEKQSTNDLTYSEDFSNVAWNNVRGVVTANSTISPDGTQNADTFASASGQAFPPALTRTPTFAGNTRYSLSIFAKVLGNTNIFSLGYVDNATGFTGGSAVYNLATQVVTITQSPNASVTASMQDYGNGWYRLVLSFLTIASPTFNYFQIGQTTNDVANAFALYGAQLEASSYPTSYIPTTSSSATRVADACSKTGISSLIGQTEGVVFWDIEVETLSATGNENILNIDAGSFGNTIYFVKGTTGALSAEVYVTGVAQCSFSYSLPSVGRYKMALAYKANDFAFYVNGVLRGTDSSGSVPTCSRVQMGNGALGSSDGKINQAVLFPTRLTNAELQALTA